MVLGAASVAAALVIGATWPAFDPDEIVITGNHRVSRAEILERAAIAPNVSIWLQSPHAIAARIETIPYVGRVAVHRIPPAEIRIVVTERAPFAALRSGTETVLVDRNLRVLTVGAPATAPVLVVAPGLDLSPGRSVWTREAIELRDAYEGMSGSRIVPAELEFDRFGGLVVTTRSGLRLLLGSQSDLAQKLTLADAILGQIVGTQRRIAAIDLRAPGTPVLVYR
jgi:cell division septal protein FtsQ